MIVSLSLNICTSPLLSKAAIAHRSSLADHLVHQPEAGSLEVLGTLGGKGIPLSEAGGL